MPDRRQGERRSDVPKKLSVSLNSFIMTIVVFIIIITSIILCRVLYIKGYNLGFSDGRDEGYSNGYDDGYFAVFDDEYYDYDNYEVEGNEDL